MPEEHLLTGLDQGLSALLEDMHERDLLDDTLVVCLGEMGRTPRFGNRGKADRRAMELSFELARLPFRGNGPTMALDRPRAAW